jgi:hypothetical protein
MTTSRSSFRSRFPALAGSSLVLLVLLVARAGALAESGDSVDFQTDVWPILERSCLECHNPNKHSSNLRMDSPERLMAGGDGGRVLEPGDPEASSLYVRVSLPRDDLDFMPIEGQPLSESEIETLRAWIAQGADFGDWGGSGP